MRSSVTSLSALWRVRPIAAPALAIACGTLAENALPAASWAIVATLLLGAAWIVGRNSRRGSAAPAHVALLVAIAASTAWRASTLDGPFEIEAPSAIDSGAHARRVNTSSASSPPSHATAIERLRESLHPSESRILGEWRSEGSWDDKDTGRIAGSPGRFEIDTGTVRSGEIVEVLAHDEAPLFARGPVPGPAARRGRSPPIVVDWQDVVRVAPAPRGAADWIADRIEALRRTGLERARSLHDPETAGLVAALLFGDASALGDRIPDLFVRTGTYHIVAISGVQVAMVAALLVWPLGALIARMLALATRGHFDPGAAATRVVLLVLFVPVAGAGAPVVRAAIAWAVGSLAPFVALRTSVGVTSSATRPGRVVALGRRSDPLSLWTLALMLEALARPALFRSLSVQLSYAATAGLICATGPLHALLRRAWPDAARIASVDALGRSRSPLWRIPLQRALDLGLAAIAASCAAGLATLPWTWDRFGEWSSVGWLATPLSALPTLGLMVAGWIQVLVPAAPLEPLLDASAHALIRLLEALDGVPGSPCALPPRPWILLAIASFGTLLLVVRHGRGARTIAALWGVLLLPWTLRPSGLELWALDVGSGTAVVWRAPGAGAWIFDAGSRDRPDVARQAVMPLLAEWDVGKVTIALSHSDRDHDGALPFVAERVPVAAWIGAVPAHASERFPHTSLALDVDGGRANVLFSVAFPPALEVALERPLAVAGNEGSRLLRIRWAGEEIVLCGDAEEEGLARWLASSGVPTGARLLLLPHHGSEGPHFGALLRRTRPREVWVSAGSKVPTAHELERTGVAWSWTARDGPLRLEIPAPSRTCALGHAGCALSHRGA